VGSGYLAKRRRALGATRLDGDESSIPMHYRAASGDELGGSGGRAVEGGSHPNRVAR